MINFLRQRWHGFTLIELLVVIAIIAILAAVLTPAVTDALTKGKMTGTLANGRSIYQALFAKEVDDPVFQSGSPYPGGPQATTNSYQNSTDYWKYVVTGGVMKVDFSFFSAPNVTPAKTTNPVEFTQANNAWCISADVSDSTPDQAPMLFTRNLNIMALTELTPDNGVVDTLLVEGNNIPYGKKGVPTLLKGGSGLIFKPDSLKPNFNAIQATNKVLRPTGAPEA